MATEDAKKANALRRRLERGGKITSAERSWLKAYEAKPKRGRKRVTNVADDKIDDSQTVETPAQQVQPDAPVHQHQLPGIDIQLPNVATVPTGQGETGQPVNNPTGASAPQTANAPSQSPGSAVPLPSQGVVPGSAFTPNQLAIASTVEQGYLFGFKVFNAELEKRGGVVVPQALIEIGAKSAGIVLAHFAPKDMDPMVIHGVNAGIPVGLAAKSYLDSRPKKKSQREEARFMEAAAPPPPPAPTPPERKVRPVDPFDEPASSPSLNFDAAPPAAPPG